jgi:hypothetical protein
MTDFFGLFYSKILSEETKKYPLLNDCIATKQTIDELKFEIEINTKKALSEKNGSIYSITAKAQKEILQRQMENADLNRCQNLFTNQKINELQAIISQEQSKYESEISSQTEGSNKLVLYIGGGALALGFLIILYKGK